MPEQSKKEYYIEEYFHDVKPKHLKPFKKDTPGGYTITGFICKKPNRLLGSMLIEEIQKGDTVYNVEQFVHAMPKINYYSYKNEMFIDSDMVTYPCYEKLDGSCLILYGIYDDEGNLLEVVPKTRGVPVADKHIIEMYNELDHSNIECFFSDFSKRNTHYTLLFELYGQLNMHTIFYPEIRISLALIGLTQDGVLCDHHRKEYFAQQYDFNLPKKLFHLQYNNGFWRVAITPGMHAHYLLKNMTDAQIEGLKIEYSTQFDAINAVKEYLDIINKNYNDVHNHILTEGVCVNTFDSTGNYFNYIKIKPSTITEAARAENGVPRKFIIKEVLKYFDEYGSQAKDIFVSDENHAYDYIMKNLSEEFDQQTLDNKRTKNRVRSIFIDFLDAKQPPKGLQDICNELVEEYPNQEVVDYMRLFAQEYPEKKRNASMAFSIFEKLVSRK